MTGMSCTAHQALQQVGQPDEWYQQLVRVLFVKDTAMSMSLRFLLVAAIEVSVAVPAVSHLHL